MINEELQERLLSSNIVEEFHELSLENYKFVVDWLESEDGELFVSGKKGLVLVGGYEAEIVGNIMEKVFVRDAGGGYVTDLVEIADKLLDDEMEIYTSLFISGFQDDGKCPISQSSIYNVYRHLKIRDNRIGHTILHVIDRNFDWWLTRIKQYINKHYFFMDINDKRA